MFVTNTDLNFLFLSLTQVSCWSLLRVCGWRVDSLMAAQPSTAGTLFSFSLDIDKGIITRKVQNVDKQINTSCCVVGDGDISNQHQHRIFKVHAM